MFIYLVEYSIPMSMKKRESTYRPTKAKDRSRNPGRVTKCGKVCTDIKNTTIALVVAIGVIALVAGILYVSGWLNYLWYKPLVDVVDPSTIQWYHWFFWSSDVLDAALFAFYPNIWWGVTLIVSVIFGIIVFIWILVK